MKRTATIALSLFLVTILGGSTIVQPVSAAKPPSKTPTQTGNDISYPQCGKTLPTGQAFGIVGVTGGKATTVNPCLAEQLAWANGSTGVVAAQPKVQLYVNTANPGEVIDQVVTTWPKSGETPYGPCDGTNTKACSWLYGRERAITQEQMFKEAAATVTGLSSELAGYVVWLDVETENSWQSASAAGLEYNRTTLEAMADYFREKGATVGVYSTNYQYNLIAGTIPATSSLYDLDSWMAGARTVRGARSNCKNSPLNPGGRVILSQYVSAGLDYDISCI